MGQIEGDAGSGHLGRMDTVAADPGCRIHKCHDLTAALHELEGNHQTHIAGAEHQHPLSRQHAVQVHHGLGSTGTDDTRKGPAREGHHVLRSPRCDNDGISLDVANAVALLHHDFLILIQADDRRIQLHLYAGLIRLCQKLLTDDEASYLCPMLLGAEELVNLLEKLSSRLLVLIEYNDLQSSLCCLDGG